jgi:DNA adenine methylase
MTSNLFKHDGGILVPPLKWAGGKRWAAKVIKAHIPSSFERYFEPFLGGGAVFFSLAPESAVLSDTNEELVTAYNALRLDWKRVWASLRIHAKSHSDSYY